MGVNVCHNWKPFGKLLPIAPVIVRTTLNVIVRQMPPNVRPTTVRPSFKKSLSNSQTLRQRYFHLLRKRCRSVWEPDNKSPNDGHTIAYRTSGDIWYTFNVIPKTNNATSKNPPSSVTKWPPITTYIHPPGHTISVVDNVLFVNKMSWFQSSSENQQNRTEVLFHYSMHHYSGKSPALNTLIFSK